MGARFSVNHINLVGYLTDETGQKAPRSDKKTIIEFLQSLIYCQNLFSSTEWDHEDWARKVAETARIQIDLLMSNSLTNDYSKPINSRVHLDPLKIYFVGYDFYSLIFHGDRCSRNSSVIEFFMEAGFRSGAHGLVLLPSSPSTETLTQFVDPFPALRVLADHPVAPPSVLFWTRLGSACALPLSDALRFLRHDLLDALSGGLRATDKAIAYQASRQRSKRILHLSDLHFGLKEATQRRSYLKRHVKELLPSIDRVAVTGDLLDTPSESLRSYFDEFRLDIENETNKKLLVVPGNHDMRFHGNELLRIGRRPEHIIDLDWRPIEIDDDMQAVFLSFNSSESGNLARGGVSLRQRLSRAEMHDDEIRRRSEVRDYFNIALVHHHPLDYSTQPTALYERILSRLGISERVIAFEESEDFLQWCASRQVGLVLHGHKHIPHLATLRPMGKIKNEVTVVGCGSSVGAEWKPMCYDIITIEPDTKRWSVSFYQDERGDGSGFMLQNVALDLRVSQ